MQELADCWDSRRSCARDSHNKTSKKAFSGALKLKELRQGDSIRNRMENLLKDSIGLDKLSTRSKDDTNNSRHFEFRSKAMGYGEHFGPIKY